MLTKSSVLLSLSLTKFEVNQDLISVRQWVREEGGVWLTGKIVCSVNKICSVKRNSSNLNMK